MATHTNDEGEFALHGVTLVADTEDIVNFGDDFNAVEVTLTAGTDPIYFTVDGTPAVVEGKNTFRVPGIADAALQVEIPTSGDTEVRLISEGASSYSIIGG